MPDPLQGPAGWPAVVLAGQRTGASPLARAAGVAADVLVPVAGRASVLRVIDALAAASCVRPRVLVGPALAILHAAPDLEQALQRHEIQWREPQGDPATSALAAIADLAPPLLITTGDHALLTADLVDGFCIAAHAVDADLVVGLVPFALVREAFPDSRRTVLKFADASSCGSNLFLLNSPRGARALQYWSHLQQHRKRPWRIARALGLGLLCRYLMRRLSLNEAIRALSMQSGCRVGSVTISDPRAAVDVDSEADWRLADRLLAGHTTPS